MEGAVGGGGGGKWQKCYRQEHRKEKNYSNFICLCFSWQDLSSGLSGDQAH